MSSSNGHNNHLQKISFAGFLVTIGIIFGDIGTSPLYVMKAIIGPHPITEEIIFGAISCVFWTLTFQTTLKYVVLTLRADNNGEGGIFSLYTLIRRYPGKVAKKTLVILAIIGGASLLADGMITPPISVSSAIEGIQPLYPGIPTVPITISIITLLFLFQRFGTSIVGKAFGPIMLVWFSMLAVLGISQIAGHPEVLKAINPMYAYNLLVNHPGGFWLLGAVFLCTTGAEALYSDLGHCGRPNIRLSWSIVKTALLLNYAGQGAWLLNHLGQPLPDNPFYGIMPDWFRPIGIGVATLATIIASQALISGSFTLISEAIRLNLYPKVQVLYPTNLKGQLYIPSINYLLWAGCVGMVLFFQESTHMEAAYGLSITITMMMTTILLVFYMRLHMRDSIKWFIPFFMLVYGTIEGAFLIANLEKFPHGGYVTVLLAGLIVFVMYVCYRAHEIRRDLIAFEDIRHYLPKIKALSNDESVPKTATHLVFMSTANKECLVEKRVLYSILQKQPKRADIYWFVHIDVADEPYTMEYKVRILDRKHPSGTPQEGEETFEYMVRVDFRLGFRVQQRISQYLRLVIKEMIENGEIDVTSRYTSLKEHGIVGDFKFVIIEEFLSQENDLPFVQEFIMNSYYAIKNVTASPEKWFGLDTSTVETEKVPLVIRPVEGIRLVRKN